MTVSEYDEANANEATGFPGLGVTFWGTLLAMQLVLRIHTVRTAANMWQP